MAHFAVAGLGLYGLVAIGAALPVTFIMKYTIGPGATGALFLLSSGVLTPLAFAWGAYEDSNMRGRKASLMDIMAISALVGAVVTIPNVGLLYATGTLGPGLRTLRLIK